MPELRKPTVDELEFLRLEATKNGKVSETEWVERCCKETARILRKDPLRYRSYGPYWWVQKQAMLDSGITDFGDFVDKEWHESADYGNAFLNLLVALLYSNAALDAGLIYSNAHNVTFLPDDPDREMDEYVYTVADDEMELLGLQKNLIRK